VHAHRIKVRAGAWRGVADAMFLHVLRGRRGELLDEETDLAGAAEVDLRGVAAGDESWVKMNGIQEGTRRREEKNEIAAIGGNG